LDKQKSPHLIIRQTKKHPNSKTCLFNGLEDKGHIGLSGKQRNCPMSKTDDTRQSGLWKLPCPIIAQTKKVMSDHWINKKICHISKTWMLDDLANRKMDMPDHQASKNTSPNVQKQRCPMIRLSKKKTAKPGYQANKKIPHRSLS